MTISNNLRRLSLAALILVGPSGCIPSKKPLSDARESRIDERLVGTWRTDDGTKTTTIVCRPSQTKGHPPGMMRYEQTDVDRKTNKLSTGTTFCFVTNIGYYSFINLITGASLITTPGGERRPTDYNIEGDYEASLGSDFEQYSFLMYSIGRDRATGRETLTIWDPNEDVARQAVRSGAVKGEIGEDSPILGTKGSVKFNDTSENLARFFNTRLGVEMFTSGKASVLARIDRAPQIQARAQDPAFKQHLDAVKDAFPLIALGQYAAAIRKLDAVLAADLTNGVAYAARAEARLRGLPFQDDKEEVRKTLQAVIDDCNNALSAAPDLLWPHKLLGEAFSEAGDYRAAIASYDEFIQNSPGEKDPDTFTGRGFARQRLGDLTGALADFSKAIDLDRTKYNVFETRAKIYVILNDFDHALSDYRVAVDLLKAKTRNSFDDNELARLQANRAETRRAAGDAQGADDDLFEMIKAGGRSRSMVSLRIDHDKYWSLIARLVARHPESRELHQLRAEANEDSADKNTLAKARDDYSKLIDLSATNEERRSALAGRARVQRNLGNLDDAVADIRAAGQLGEDSSLDRLLAAILSAKSDWSGVVQTYTTALNLPTRPKGDDKELYLYRGEAYRKLGQLDKARADLDESLRLAPSFGAAYGSRGLVLAEQHRDSEAKIDFEQGMKLDRFYFDHTVMPALKEILARQGKQTGRQPK